MCQNLNIWDVFWMNQVQIRRCCKKVVSGRRVTGDKRIDDDVLQWFGHVEKIENDRIAKRVYVGECSGSCSVGRLQER